MRAYLFTADLRVYFNRHGADGLSWCVASESGAWELAVREVSIRVPTTTVYKAKSTPDDEDGRPSAWLTVSGALWLDETGLATIAACDQCGDRGLVESGMPCRCGAKLDRASNVAACSRCGDRGVIQGVGLAADRFCDCAAGQRLRPPPRRAE